MAEINAGTLYDMNQSIMANIKGMSKEAYETAEKKLKAFFMNNIKEKYFMLLCKELSDYTVLMIDSTIKCGGAVSDLKETIKNRGIVLSISETDDNAFEIWIKTSADSTPHVYYLFPYGIGVIEV